MVMELAPPHSKECYVFYINIWQHLAIAPTVPDVNKNGTVQKSEVTAKLQALGYTPAEIDNIWKISDTDEDNQLSSDEFIANFAQFLILK